MTNIEKAEKANYIAKKIKECDEEIGYLNGINTENSDEMKVIIDTKKYHVCFEGDINISILLLSMYEQKKEGYEQELDYLLNGKEKEIKRILSQENEE